MRKILFALGMGLSLVSGQAGAIELDAKAHYIYHPETATIVSSENAGQQIAPASLVKLMTLYILFEALEEGVLTLDSELPVSKEAWQKGGSKMFVEVGKQVRVEDLIQGIAVSSGNDACLVVAEYLGGTEAEFAARMNEKAAELGLISTNFVNASGWPDPAQLTTAEDITKLAVALWQNFPDRRSVFSQESFTYSDIAQRNRNRLLGKGYGVDGMKTGHIEEAGYHLVTTAERADDRFFVTVLGADSESARAEEALKGLNFSFNTYTHEPFIEPGANVGSTTVKYGVTPTVSVIAPKGLEVLIPRGDKGRLKVSYTLAPITAPVAAGQELGKASVRVNGETYETPLVAATAVKQKGWFGRQAENIQAWLSKK